MASISLRGAVERLSRDRRFKRRLPAEFGRRPIWVSPDARLRFLKFGNAAFDKELLGYARRWIKPRDVVLDIGANVGEFSVSAAHRVGHEGGVLAIEADPFLASLLQRTVLEPANADLRLDTMCVAAAGQTGIARFSLSNRGRAANALEGSGTTQMGGVRRSTYAPTIAIDAVVAAWRAPDFMKIDVEGVELAVFQGAEHTLRTHRPTILFESSEKRAEIMALLGSLDYVLYDPDLDMLDKPLTDCLFNTLAVHKSRLAALSSCS